MSYIVSVTQEAKSDLRSIYCYISFELLSPENAKGQMDRLKKAISTLREFPTRYRLMEDEPWKSRGLRTMPCDNFLIFYLVKEEKNEVIVSRVLYGKRDIARALKE